MSPVQVNPMGRHYTPEELKAASRLNVFSVLKPTGGQLFYATGDYFPNHMKELASKYQALAQDAILVAEAVEREWQKPLPESKQEDES